MKKKSLIGIIAGVVLVPVVACAILLNFKGVGIEDNSAKRDLADYYADKDGNKFYAENKKLDIDKLYEGPILD